MTFCNEQAMPHSEFLSWDQDDRDKAVAQMMEKSGYCSLCGTAEWEWEENPHAYTPEERVCRGCYMKESASEDAGSMHGTSIELVPATPEVLERQQLHYERLRSMDVRDQPAEGGEEPVPIG